MIKILNMFIANCDSPEHWQYGMQDPATPVMEGILYFHNYLAFFLVVICVVVFWMLFITLTNFEKSINKFPNRFTHSSVLEIIWTVIPACVLLLIAIPSFALLYSLDELVDPVLTLKVVGHQWYWSYEYSDYFSLEGGDTLSFDSYMVPESDLVLGSFRLLEVDNRVVLPIKTHIRVLVTSSDVLHSWAIPSFGIKVDATPGRLSQASLFIKREGVYYGQCSEICGVNHAFMPIVVKGTSTNQFVSWLSAKLDNLVLN